jgi:hypothetical protein
VPHKPIGFEHEPPKCLGRKTIAQLAEEINGCDENPEEQGEVNSKVPAKISLPRTLKINRNPEFPIVSAMLRSKHAPREFSTATVFATESHDTISAARNSSDDVQSETDTVVL